MTIRLVLCGALTVDFERARSQRKLIAKLAKYEPGQAPQALVDNIKRLSARTPFWVPLKSKSHSRQGVVVWTDEGESPYDLGLKANWELVMGSRWDCLKVWKARCVGRQQDVHRVLTYHLFLQQSRYAEVAASTFGSG